MMEMILAQPNQSGKLRGIHNQSFEEWLEKGPKSRPEIAREMVKEILSTHQAEPLPDSVKKEMADIIEKAERQQMRQKISC